MKKNDYITTGSERIQQTLNSLPVDDYNAKRQTSIQMSKQLNSIISGKQLPIPLSNPIRFLAQDFVDGIAKDSSVSPEKRCLFYTHLSQYIKKISLYLKKRQATTSTQYEALPHEPARLPTVLRRASERKRFLKCLKTQKEEGEPSMTSKLSPKDFIQEF